MPEIYEKMRLGDILIRAGVLSRDDLDEALRNHRAEGLRLGEYLVSKNIVGEMRIAEALSNQLKLPFTVLGRFDAAPEAIKLVPKQMSKRLGSVPLKITTDGRLAVAMSDPLDLAAQDELSVISGYELDVHIATRSDVMMNIDRLYDLQSSLSLAAADMEELETFEDETGSDISEIDVSAAPIIQLVNQFIRQSVREGASDIHVEAEEDRCRVRFRIDGQLYTAFDYPRNMHSAVAARVKIMANMDIAEKRKPQDGRILLKVDNKQIDFRVSALPTIMGEKMVLRILDRANTAVGLEKLGLEHSDMNYIEEFCVLPWGIVLATGPTGSGKSTTLYSMLERINTKGINIVTVEDPVEYIVRGANQVHIHEKAGMTFPAALRSILRQDPDKIMIGEIRDAETAQIAIRSALTGHLVLSTLHTNDAPSASTRLIDMGIPPFLVANSLSGVIAQRLVRKLCPFCREEYGLDVHTAEQLGVEPGTKAYRPKGCNECRDGYKGRRAIFEILKVDDDMRDAILRQDSVVEMRRRMAEKGMRTLRSAGLAAALAGDTSVEEMMSVTL